MGLVTASTQAANGIVGLETAVPLGLRLVEQGVISLSGLVEKMSINPGRIIGRANRIMEGNTANLTILDTEKAHTIDAKQFKSLSQNTPFDGWKLKGKAVLTMVEGKIVYEDI